MAFTLELLYIQFNNLIWEFMTTIGKSNGFEFLGFEVVYPLTECLTWTCVVICLAVAFAIPFALLYKLTKYITGDIYK